MSKRKNAQKPAITSLGQKPATTEPATTEPAITNPEPKTEVLHKTPSIFVFCQGR